MFSRFLVIFDFMAFLNLRFWRRDTTVVHGVLSSVVMASLYSSTVCVFGAFFVRILPLPFLTMSAQDRFRTGSPPMFWPDGYPMEGREGRWLSNEFMES